MRYTFGAYTLDTARYELCYAGTPRALRPKVFQALVYLLAHCERTVTKTELGAALWPGQVVTASTLDSCIAEARHAVGDSGRLQQVIHTRHGYGYRFIAPVHMDGPQGSGGLDWAPPACDLSVEHGPATSTLIAGEHKVITVLVWLFTETGYQGSRQAAEQWHTVRQTYLACIRDEVQRFAGTLQEVSEQRGFIFFGVPSAQEDHAVRAVRAGLSLRQQCVHHARGAPSPLRFGVHTGALVFTQAVPDGPLDYTAVGDTLTLATRVTALAPPGGLVMSEATASSVHDLFETSELRASAVSKMEASLRVYEVRRARPQRTRWEVMATRRLAPYVGRARESALLEMLFQEVQAGRGHVVWLAGEAGIGKSRHVYEFHRALTEAGHPVTWMEGRCVSFGQHVPFLPIIEQMRAVFGLDEADEATHIVAKLAEGARRLAVPDAHLPALRYLLAVEEGESALAALAPATRRSHLFEALLTLLWCIAQRQPLVLLYEDVQWSDNSTMEFLAQCIDAVASLPLFLLLTSRVGTHPLWQSRSFLTTLSLQRLTDDETLRMAAHWLGSTALPAAWQRLLLTQTAGVPLFVEEWLTTVAGEPMLPGLADRARVSHEPTALTIPATIAGVLTARLDQLSHDGKRLARLAAVIGREFPLRLLQQLVGPSVSVDGALVELQAREIIACCTMLPEPLYAFKHALFQEVAYQSLLLQDRQALHRQVGHALETCYPERVTEHAGELAHHFVAGQEWSRAFTYSVLAGDRAADAYANAEAAMHYAQALQAAGQCVPAPAADVLASLSVKHGAVLTVLAAYDEAIAAYQRALTQMRQAGDRHGEVAILLQLSTIYVNTHRFGAAPAIACVEEALPVARALQDPALQAVCLAQRARIMTRGYGHLRAAMPDAEEAVTLARGTMNPALQAEALTALGRMRQWQGQLRRSLPLLHEGARLAEQAHEGFVYGMALFFRANAQVALGAYEEALRSYQQLQAYAQRAGDRYWQARIPNTLGGLYLEVADVPMALACLREEVGSPEEPTWSEVQGHTLVQHASAALLQGEDGQAEACVRRAIQLLDVDVWMRWRWRIALLRVQGELALAHGQYAEAWTAALASRALALETDSRKHLARAYYLQGTILAATGRLGEAAQILEASVRLATKLHVPREQWMGRAALGRVYGRLGQDLQAERAYQDAWQTIETLATALTTPALQQTFLSAARVQEVSQALGHPARP